MTTDPKLYHWISPGKGPLNLYQAQASRSIDTAAATFYQTPSFELMKRAGQAAFACLSTRWPQAEVITLVCGTGNNGGDGFVVARLAARAFDQVQVILVGSKSQITKDAAKALKQLESTPVKLTCLAPDDRQLLRHISGTCTHLWVDALFGSGLNRTLTPAYTAIIDQLNQHPAPVFSLDLPSGIHPDTGAVLGNAVKAAVTLSFITLKPGQFRDTGKAHCGQLGLAQLAVENCLMENYPSTATRLHFKANALPSLHPNAHKGTQGTLVCIGGNQGMGGAILLAAQAALHLGVGKIHVATQGAHQTALLARQPELMWLDPEDTRQLKAKLEQATAVVIGPGLGQDAWAQALLNALRELSIPIIADADALNLMAKRSKPAFRFNTSTLVITPHLGEARRLVDRYCAGLETAAPFQIAQTLADKLNAFTILKGAGTLISEPNQATQFICDAGNPGMAKAGMGDVLAGAIAGLIAQPRLPPHQAIKLGTWLHSTAADQIAAQEGIYNLLPSKLPEAMGRLLHNVCQTTA